ncbi:hypothetical protein GCM10007198_13670 [Microbacterium aerolatum]|uniref:Uncharacterized protein n=2 Tax=Microbacterium aerolatum TaxID=153731 RepID=A0A511AFR6_9MICO|nr:hypothetical protein MAE01_20280 [Microbacterium aerolatum]GGB24601.1 hypothetical protein GCM10007198_13670 [Microbacterium aerolatum]
MLALLVMAGATLSACSPTPEPSPTPTAAFASEEEAFAAAEEVYRAYVGASNAVDYSDPSTFEALDAFTTGAYRSDEREGLSQMHAEGNSRTGDIKITWFNGTQFVPPNSVTARTCNDVSATDVIDKDGKSIVSEDRPTHYAIELTFVANGDQLMLSTSQAIEDPKCASQ